MLDKSNNSYTTPPIHPNPSSLAELENGRTARVKEVRGDLIGRLDAMGIVPGTTLRKKSAAPLKGPIVIERNSTQLAIGYGIARGIIVESIAAFVPEEKPRLRRVVIVGNPNVGKSLLFSRITKSGAISANYAGTTVSVKNGRFQYRDSEYEIVDGPGLYSLGEYSEADATALRLLEEGDIILDVIDATNLERNLNLTLQLITNGKPMIVCLNLWDDTAHKGVMIDVKALEHLLGLPVVATSALRGEGIAELIAAFDNARPGSLEAGGDGTWSRIGEIVNQVQRLRHRHHTFLELLGDFAVAPVGGIVTAAAVLVATLLIVRFMGEGLLTFAFAPLYSDFYAPFVRSLVGRVPWDFLRVLLVGNGTDPLASFGILTSGVYISFVQVFPYYFSFYFVFGFLEDFGYLPRLSVTLDKLFHRLGLHGYSAIPVMLGLGCKVPALLSTRALANKREKELTTTLILMSAPCLPQTSMIVSLGMGYGVGTVASVFAVLLAVSVLVNFLMNKIRKGKPDDLFVEIPPYRMPSARLIAAKLTIRIREFLGEVLPLIAVGVLAMNLLESLGVIGFITEAIKKPVAALLGLPAEIAPIMLLGFLRKDVSIALLAPLGLTSTQFVIGSVFLALYMPCVSSFATLIKESGFFSALRIAALVFLSALGTGFVLHILLG